MEIVKGNVAVVTGAASGIGLAISEQLAQANAHVLMTDRNHDALAEAALVVRARSTGAEIETLPLDVSDPDAVEAAATRAVERFGALHIAVNNAGVVNRGLFMGTVARRMAPSPRRQPVRRDPWRARVRPQNSRDGSARPCRECRIDGSRAPTGSTRALHGRETWRARPLRRPPCRIRRHRRSDRSQRRLPRPHPNGHEPHRQR